MHPGHYFYNFVRSDVGISGFADIAKKKPKLGLCVGNPDFIAGRIAREGARRFASRHGDGLRRPRRS